MQVTIVHWITLLFTSAASNAILLVILFDRWTFEPVFVTAFFAASSMIPFFLSIVGTLHLSGVGEKRVLGTTGINLLTIPIVILLECVLHGQDLGVFISNSFLLSVYLVILGYVEPLATRPMLGVSGGQSQCKKEFIVLGMSYSDMRTLLGNPKISETLEVGSLEKQSGFCLMRTPENVGFNCYIFLFPHATDAKKSILFLIGYTRTDYEIIGDTAAQNSLRGKRIYLLALLHQRVSLDPPTTLESFLEKCPEFIYSATKAYKLALKPTEIPLKQIKALPASVVALLLAIIIPVLAAAILYAGGLLDLKDMTSILLPSVILIAVEALLFRLGRKG
jgi:hypothetical protein